MTPDERRYLRPYCGLAEHLSEAGAERTCEGVAV